LEVGGQADPACVSFLEKNVLGSKKKNPNVKKKRVSWRGRERKGLTIILIEK